MFKNAITAVVGLFLAASLTQANAIVWELSTDANATGVSNTTTTGQDALDGGLFVDASATQDIGIFGAGFTMGSGVDGIATLSFDADLTTWDSYSAYNPDTLGGTGYWDGFIVMLSQDDYYWNLTGLSDPIAANDSTFVWGGDTYGDAVENYFSTEETLTGVGAGKWYVSFVLDTATLPDSDHSYASYGSFHVTSVPEPGTLLLLGGGLLGLTFTSRRKRKIS